MGASGAGGEREPPRLAQLEAILDELNRRVYKPMARGWAASARKAVRPESATSKSASAWAQRPGAALWDTFGQAWSLHDIALFEAAFALYGKDFEAIQRVVSSKTTREIVNFFYLWKMTSHYRVYKVKATARADRAKASAMAAAMAAATAAAGKKAVTSKHPLSTFWGSHKNSKGKKRQAASTSTKSGGGRGRFGSAGDGQGPKKKAKKRQKTKQKKPKRVIGGGPIMSDGKPIAKLLGVPLYPGDLKRAVQKQGGIVVVRKRRIWQAVRKEMKLKKTSSSGHTLNTAYKRYESIGAFDEPMMEPPEIAGGGNGGAGKKTEEIKAKELGDAKKKAQEEPIESGKGGKSKAISDKLLVKEPSADELPEKN